MCTHTHTHVLIHCTRTYTHTLACACTFPGSLPGLPGHSTGSVKVSVKSFSKCPQQLICIISVECVSVITYYNNNDLFRKFPGNLAYTLYIHIYRHSIYMYINFSNHYYFLLYYLFIIEVKKRSCVYLVTMIHIKEQHGQTNFTITILFPKIPSLTGMHSDLIIRSIPVKLICMVPLKAGREPGSSNPMH